MSEIELKRANVVKRVDSEDKAKALEAKGLSEQMEQLRIKQKVMPHLKL